jgi:hypothetical protein
MMRVRGFFKSVLVVIVCCVWVLFWFVVLTSITDDPDYSELSQEQAFVRVSLCLFMMAVVPFGFLAARLLR